MAQSKAIYNSIIGRIPYFYIALTAFIGYVCLRMLSTYNVTFLAGAGILIFLFLSVVVAFKLVGIIKPSARLPVNFKLLLVAVFVSFLLAEGILRLLRVNITYTEILGQRKYYSPYWNDKNFWYLYNPVYEINNPRKDFTHFRLVNSMGIPEREIALAGAGRVKKILTLGDSFTEGIGASSDSTWPRLLEHYLNANSEDSFIVYNAGISGSDPVYEYHLLRGRLWDINWNAVIFCINGTDIEDCKIRGGLERFKDNGTVTYRKAPAWEPLYACSYLFRFVINNILGHDDLLLTKKESIENEKRAVSDIRQTMQQAHRELVIRNIPMLVVIHPLKGEQDVNRFHNRNMDTLLHRMRDLRPLNLLPYFADSLGTDKTSEELYWPNDAHFKPEGYRIMAEKICRELAPRL